MDGLILINKPEFITSHDVVAAIRKIVGQRKVGHCGTLDPLATGLLLVSLGKATRLFPFLSKLDKAYRGQIRLGFSTETYDAQGKPSSPQSDTMPEEEDVRKAMSGLTGEYPQTPPPYSAKKYKGKPLYHYARNKLEVQVSPQRVFILDFRLSDYSPPILSFEVQCSTGTYVRSLANDLGLILRCGAHIRTLERTRAGYYGLADVQTLDDLKNLSREDIKHKCLIPMEDLLPECPKVVLNTSGADLARNGNLIMPENTERIFPPEIDLPSGTPTEGIFRLFSGTGTLLALARPSKDEIGLHPFLVVDSAGAEK